MYFDSIIMWPRGQVAKTLPLHGRIAGSIPVEAGIIMISSAFMRGIAEDVGQTHNLEDGNSNLPPAICWNSSVGKAADL